MTVGVGSGTGFTGPANSSELVKKQKFDTLKGKLNFKIKRTHLSHKCFYCVIVLDFDFYRQKYFASVSSFTALRALRISSGREKPVPKTFWREAARVGGDVIRATGHGCIPTREK